MVASQAILGTDPNPPHELTVSMEADIYPMKRPELADEIDGELGGAKWTARCLLEKT